MQQIKRYWGAGDPSSFIVSEYNEISWFGLPKSRTFGHWNVFEPSFHKTKRLIKIQDLSEDSSQNNISTAEDSEENATKLINL